MKNPLRIIVSGASSGIGFQLAKRYLEQGAVVGVISRQTEKLRFFEQNWPDSVRVYSADVRDLHALQLAAADFMSRFGCPDIVVANAGISCGTLTEHAADIEVFQAIFDTNVVGMAKTFQPYLGEMKSRGHGKLVGIASIAGFRGLPGASAYSSSKAAVINYLEALRCELFGTGIRVITICPGYVETPMTYSNPYPMPFLVRADLAARMIESAIARNRIFYAFPWQMMLIGKLLGILPKRLHAFLFSRAPHKPRRPDQ